MPLSLLARLAALKPQPLTTAQRAILPPGKAPSTKPLTTPKDLPAASLPYWTPDAVILWHPTWHCTCGASGPCTPQLFVRESHRGTTRLSAISNPLQYSLLPRFIEHAAPSHVHFCPECFAGVIEHSTHQLSFDWHEPPTPYNHPRAYTPDDTPDDIPEFTNLKLTPEDFDVISSILAAFYPTARI